MARGDSQYESRLAYLIENDRVYGWDFIDKPVDELTPREKSLITREFNITRLAMSSPELAHLKNKTRDDYHDMLSKIRPFTGTKFAAKNGYSLRDIEKLKPNQKREISRYFEALAYATSRGSMVWYNSTSKKAVQVAREIVGEEFKGLPAVRGAFIAAETMGEQTHVHVDVNAKVMTLKTPSRETVSIKFADFGYTPTDLALDPVGVVKDVTSQVPADTYTIQAGEHQIGRGVKAAFGPSGVADTIRSYVSKYGADKFDPNDSNSHYFGNWLLGLFGHTYPNLAARNALRRAERLKADAKRKAKTAARRKARSKSRAKR